MKMHKPSKLATAVGSVMLAGAAMAQAQGQLMLEEVLVTAQKRVESLQDVPISVVAVSGEKINDVGITNLEELTLYTPNVNINSGQATPNLFIRGVGSGTNVGFEQSVGMYIDGIYAGRGQLANVPTTLDLERVEILKGPQGILFGKNTIGGAINITTAKPTDEFEAYAEAIYAPEDNEQIYTGVISGPLTDTVSGRIAARYEGMDGWYDNKTLDEEGPDKDNTYIRTSLRWDASDDIEVMAKYEYGDFKVETLPQVVYQSDQPINFLGEEVFPVISDSDKGASDVTVTNDTRTDVAGLTIDWDLDFATLTSISAYSAYDTDRVDNSDMSPTATINRLKREEFDQWSQELRLVSPGGDTIDWIVGAYYEKSNLKAGNLNTDLDFARIGPISVRGNLVYTTDERVWGDFDQDSESWATFAQGTWNVTDRFRTTLGIRYNDETKELDKVTQGPGLAIRAGNQLPAANIIVYSNPANRQSIEDLRSHSFTGLDRDEDKWTWSGNVQYDVGDDSMVYAAISTGYKAGGYDEAYSGAGYTVRLVNPFTGVPTGETVPGADPSVLEYEPEEVLAYEVGAKMRLLDGAAELNIAVFRMEYDDLQVSSLVGDVFRVTNAGESTSQGVEVDGRWRATDRLTLGGSLAYLDATYDDFKGASCTIPQTVDPVNNPGCLDSSGNQITAPLQNGGQDLGGEDMLFAPEWAANLNAEYVFPLGNELELRTSVDMNYSDEFYSALDLDPSTKHDSFVKWNARIALASVDDKWQIAVIGKNLTDEETWVWKNDVAISNSNSYFAIPERPRSIAIQARYRFE